MGWWERTACLLVLALAGCFNPAVTSGGFACVATDDPPCPSGFFCVNGLCVDHPGSVDDQGGVGGNGSDLSGVADLASRDLASADLAAPPPDMTMMCGKAGSICFGNGSCCSNACLLLICL